MEVLLMMGESFAECILKAGPCLDAMSLQVPEARILAFHLTLLTFHDVEHFPFGTPTGRAVCSAEK